MMKVIDSFETCGTASVPTGMVAISSCKTPCIASLVIFVKDVGEKSHVGVS